VVDGYLRANALDELVAGQLADFTRPRTAIAVSHARLAGSVPVVGEPP